VSPTASTTGPSGASATSSTTQAGSVDKNMFLQLLVAQLKNQDPLNPTDGTAFVGQLAQFQQLEQSVNMAQDVTAMRQDLDTLTQSAGTAKTQA
jgi:flagellar basal-body rod modification protein FlgD